MVRHPKTFLFYDAVRVRVLKSTPLRRVLIYAEEERTEILCHKHAPISADFGCVAAAKRRGDHVDKFADENFSFWSRTNKKTIHFSKKFLLKRTEEKNGFCTVFAVLIQKKRSKKKTKKKK